MYTFMVIDKVLDKKIGDITRNKVMNMDVWYDCAIASVYVTAYISSVITYVCYCGIFANVLLIAKITSW
jgi:hypothetical protein